MSCLVEGCENVHLSLGYCSVHYQRLRRTGKPEGVHRQTCSVDGCQGKHRSNGYCRMHAARAERHGDPQRVRSAFWLPGENRPNWTGDDVTYRAMHKRVYRYRGPAKAHDCIDCGGKAGHWSYDLADPHERTDPNGWLYSTDVDHYQPRCASCHLAFDRGARNRHG